MVAFMLSHMDLSQGSISGNTRFEPGLQLIHAKADDDCNLNILQIMAYMPRQWLPRAAILSAYR